MLWVLVILRLSLLDNDVNWIVTILSGGLYSFIWFSQDLICDWCHPSYRSPCERDRIQDISNSLPASSIPHDILLIFSWYSSDIPPDKVLANGAPPQMQCFGRAFSFAFCPLCTALCLSASLQSNFLHLQIVFCKYPLNTILCIETLWCVHTSNCLHCKIQPFTIYSSSF